MRASLEIRVAPLEPVDEHPSPVMSSLSRPITGHNILKFGSHHSQMPILKFDDLDQRIDEAFERAYANWDKNPRACEILSKTVGISDLLAATDDVTSPGRPRKQQNFVRPSKASAFIEEAETTDDSFGCVARERTTRVQSGRPTESMSTMGPKKAFDGARGHAAHLSVGKRQESGTISGRYS